MKRYYPLAGRWVQLESYRRRPRRIHPTMLNIIYFMLLVFISSLTVGAMLGYDITNHQVHHEQRK